MLTPRSLVTVSYSHVTAHILNMIAPVALCAILNMIALDCEQSLFLRKRDCSQSMIAPVTNSVT